MAARIFSRPHRLVAKDTTLSRWRHGFESRWGCQQVLRQGATHAAAPLTLMAVLLHSMTQLPDAKGRNGARYQKATDSSQEERDAERHMPGSREVGDLYGSRILQDEDQQEHQHDRGGNDPNPSSRDSSPPRTS